MHGSFSRARLFTRLACICLFIKSYVLADISVSHSFGDDRYAPAGLVLDLSYSGEGLDAGTPRLLRKEFGTAEKHLLSELAAADGLYTVRVYPESSETTKYLSTSIRASCLLAARTEQLRLHVNEEGAIIGVQYEVTPSDCQVSLDAATAEVHLAAEVPISLELPRRAPSVIVTGGENVLGASKGKTPAAPQAQRQQQQQQQQAGAAGEGAEGALGQQGAAVKEEQTWFQRNWVYIAVLFGLGLQVLKAQMEPQLAQMQRQQTDPQRLGAAPSPAAQGGPAAGGSRLQGSTRRRS